MSSEMGPLVEASLVGIGVFMWLRGQTAWFLVAGFGVSFITGDDWMMLAGLGLGWGLAWYEQARQWESRRDEAEQAALVFIVRLRQLLDVTGSLAGALDEMGYRSGWAGADAGERVLDDIAQHFQVAPLIFFARVAYMIRRHGGSLSPVADWASDTIQSATALRQARRLEEATQRSTMVILALAPLGMLGVFRALVPSFFQALRSSQVGDGAIALVGVSTFTVFAVLAHHVRKEVQTR